MAPVTLTACVDEVVRLRHLNAEFVAALKECSFRLGVNVAALGQFPEVDARVLDTAAALIRQGGGVNDSVLARAL